MYTVIIYIIYSTIMFCMLVTDYNEALLSQKHYIVECLTIYQ